MFLLKKKDKILFRPHGQQNNCMVATHHNPQQMQFSFIMILKDLSDASEMVAPLITGLAVAGTNFMGRYSL